MTIQVNPEKLAEFESITLSHGAHPDFESGHCAMEVVAWLAGEGHTDAPACASRVLRNYTIALNDRWNDEQRQRLKPFLIRMIGTGDDGKDAARGRIALAHLAQLTVPWLELAGIDSTAITSATTAQETQEALDAARKAAWRQRAERREALLAKAREAVAAQDKPADADAVAADVADAVVYAAGFFDSVGSAGFIAASDAVVDTADFDAADVVAAAADAVDAAFDAAVVAAVTDAVIADVVDAASEGGYLAARLAARDYYRENPPPVSHVGAELARKQDDAALDLLDRLITAEETK